jgi:hypothetical protein
MSTDPDGEAGQRTMRMNLGVPGTESLPVRVVRAAGAPIAVAFGFAGQTLLSRRIAGASWTLGVGVALYVVAALLLVAALRRGAARTDRAASGDGETRETGWLNAPGPKLEWGLVAAVLLAGLYLRLYRIDIIPWGLNNDEAINAIEANEIATGKPFSTVTGRGLNRETMFHYLSAFSYRHPGLALNLLRSMPAVFGLQPGLINDPMAEQVLPLRFVSIIAGTLTLLALYLFARRRFGFRVAIAAAVLLAVSPWHLLYSRAGLRAILAPLFVIVVAEVALRARETGRLADHLAWGVALGLGLWTYTSFRAVPLALLAFVVVDHLLARAGAGPRPRVSRSALAGAALAGSIFALIMALSHLSPGDFLFRGTYAIMPRGASWGLNMLSSATLLNFFPARYALIQSDAFISDGISAVYGLIGMGPETVVVAALATLGSLYAAWRAFGPPREAACALPLLCVVALVLTVGVAGPSLTRLLLGLPWLCLFAALLLWRLFDDLVALLRPVVTWLQGAAAAGIAGAVILGITGTACVEGCNQYFLKAGRSERAMEHFGLTQTIMGMFVRLLPAETDIYVLHTRRVDSLRYLSGDRPDVHLVSDPSTLDLDAIARGARTVTFVVEYARPFAEPLRYLIMRYPLGDASQVADANFYQRTGRARAPDEPDRTIFFTFTLWKDATGQTIPAPGAGPPPMPGGPPPAAPRPPSGG